MCWKYHTVLNNYEKLNEETLQLARKVFQVPNAHSILFNCCGAQQHFSLSTTFVKPEEMAYTDALEFGRVGHCEEVHAMPEKYILSTMGGELAIMSP